MAPHQHSLPTHLRNNNTSGDVVTNSSSTPRGGEEDKLQFINEEELLSMAQQANKLSFRIHNTICALCIIFISLVILVAGIVIGLGLYFNFDSQSNKYIRELVAIEAKTKSTLLLEKILHLQRGIDSLVALFTIRAFPQEYFPLTDFTTFANKAFANHSSQFLYSPAIPHSQLTNYTLSVQETFSWSGFAVTQFNANYTNKEPVTNRNIYYPILYSYPFMEQLVGVDVYPLHPMLIEEVILHPNTLETSIWNPLSENENTIFRLTKVVLSLDGITVKGIVDSMIEKDDLLQMLKTEEDAMYSYIIVNHQNETLFQSLAVDSTVELLVENPYKYSQEIPFGEHLWQLHVIPTPIFVMQQTNASKWIGLIGSLLITFFLILFVALCCVIILYMIRTSKMTSSRMKIVLLAQQNLKKLIQRIATQEQQSKFILDSMQDCVVIVNTVTGKVKTANRSFQLVFQYEEEDWKELHIATVLPDLLQDFFTTNRSLQIGEEDLFLHQQLEEATSVTKAGVEYKVKVAQTPIPSFHEKYTYALVMIRLLNNNMVVSPRKSILHQPSQNELLVRHHVTSSAAHEKSSAMDLLNKLKQKQSEFYVLFRKFCKQEFTLDTLECIERIEEYKTIIDVEQRIKIQQQIGNEFFKENSKKQVNLSSKWMTKVQKRMEQQLGHVDCFDLVETVLLDTLVLNSYSRFNEMMANQEMQKHNRASLFTDFSTNSSETTLPASGEGQSSPQPEQKSEEIVETYVL